MLTIGHLMQPMEANVRCRTKSLNTGFMAILIVREYVFLDNDFEFQTTGTKDNF
jgi:hypothetical protein